MVKFSIIIPVYNLEDYLYRCLESVLNQDYNDFEIILINDGSDDNSLNIIEEFKNQYSSKIKVISQVNQGVSSARNKGLQEAEGEYIIFIDGDDYIDSNHLSNILEYIGKSKNSFILNSLFVETGETTWVIPKASKNYDCSFYGTLMNILDNHRYQGFLFNKIFSNSVIKSNELKFKENLYYAEDTEFVIRYLLELQKRESDLVANIINSPTYHYVQIKSSATHQFNIRQFSLVNSMEEIQCNLEKMKSINKEVLYVVQSNLIQSVLKMIRLSRINGVVNEHLEDSLDKIVTNSWDNIETIWKSQRKIYSKVFLTLRIIQEKVKSKKIK